MKHNMVLAGEVYWGEWIDHEKCNLKSLDNPEEACILRDSLTKLSKEACMVLRVMYELPDEMFAGTGRLIQEKFVLHISKRFGWSPFKVSRINKELTEMLR